MSTQCEYTNHVCPVCRSERFHFFCLNGSRPLKRCVDCSFVYASEIPPEDKVIHEYRKYYSTERRSLLHWKQRLSYRWQRRIIRTLFLRRREIRILHVNAGEGLFLELLDAHPRFDTIGLEQNAHEWEQAREKLLDIYQESVESLSLRDQMFDVIHAADRPGFYHNPERTCLEYQRLLAPGGLLFLSLPRMAKLPGVLRGEAWGEIVTDQLWHFTANNAAIFLQRLGFRTHFVRVPREGSSVFVVASKQLNLEWEEIPRWVGIEEETDQPSWTPEIRRAA